jgi:hypothetical protein
MFYCLGMVVPKATEPKTFPKSTVPITNATVLRVADIADVDTATVVRYLSGLEVRGRSRNRIERAVLAVQEEMK